MDRTADIRFSFCNVEQLTHAVLQSIDHLSFIKSEK